MSTSLEIEAKWLDTVFDHDDIRIITPQIWNRDVIGNQQTGCDLDRAMYNGSINFVQFFAQRYRDNDEIGGCSNYQHRVRIQYFLEQSDQYNAEGMIQSFFETLDDLVSSELGYTWGGLVEGYSRELNYPSIGRAGLVNERSVIGGRFDYFAKS